MPFTIEKITAFISVDKQSEEGLMGYYDSGKNTWIPLLCADEARVQSVFQMAELISKATGVPYRVVEFSTREDVTEQTKEKYNK